MDAIPKTELIGITLVLSADEARALYAELYRAAIDHNFDWSGGQVAAIMRALADPGFDT